MLKHASLYYYEQIFNYIHNILINVKFKSKFHIRDMNFAYFLNKTDKTDKTIHIKIIYTELSLTFY